ncbi:AraC-type DNA-binding protein [Rhizobium hainanense]|uniref:AraC-type DNA-binding protein n=2 Tax=Rhizobium hainanense TaxID=52131 RepID=A0A1C3UV90_9HYPH|nr:AraC-type DNA-binding protein [Rhizobium hainanense]
MIGDTYLRQSLMIRSMLFIPFPFVIAILLIVLLAVVRTRDDEAPPNLPFQALILLGAFQSTLSGLRWGYAVQPVMYVMPVAAAMVPPLAYLGVSRLARKSSLSPIQQICLHGLPAGLIVVLIALWRDAIDIAIVLTDVGYAAAILLLMRSGTDALRLAPFENAGPTYRAILFAASALLLSAAVDIFIWLDLAWAGGEYALKVITFGNLAALAVLAAAAAAASRSHAPVDRVEAVRPPEILQDSQTLAAVQALMKDRHAYRDVDLNLDRLARKLAIPARQISAAINRATGKNVSQYVNEYRIAEACTLLAETDDPVTEIMFEVGFQTKSNFNREFRRVTDTTPLEWRDRSRRPSKSTPVQKAD